MVNMPACEFIIPHAFRGLPANGDWAGRLHRQNRFSCLVVVNDPVLTTVFCPEQPVVGQLQDLFVTLPGDLVEINQSDTHGNMLPRKDFIDNELVLVDFFSYFFRCLKDPSSRSFGQKQHKFISAVPAEHVARKNVSFDYVRDLFLDSIARLVAVGIVYEF